MQLARKREAKGGDEFSIKNCISILNTLEVTEEEKVKAYKMFKDLTIDIYSRVNVMMWLRDEMA
jgi:hypothetical protein